VCKTLGFLKRVDPKAPPTSEEWLNIFFTSTFITENENSLLEAEYGSRCESLANELGPLDSDGMRHLLFFLLKS